MTVTSPAAAVSPGLAPGRQEQTAAYHASAARHQDLLAWRQAVLGSSDTALSRTTLC
jgi:hypothetical protein